MRPLLKTLILLVTGVSCWGQDITCITYPGTGAHKGDVTECHVVPRPGAIGTIIQAFRERRQESVLSAMQGALNAFQLAVKVKTFYLNTSALYRGFGAPELADWADLKAAEKWQTMASARGRFNDDQITMYLDIIKHGDKEILRNRKRIEDYRDSLLIESCPALI